MKPHPKFIQLLKTLEDMHIKKSNNYATEEDSLSNLKACQAFGVPAYLGCLIRMSDKWARLQQLAQGKKDQVGESITDTALDLAGYCLLFIILYDESNI